MKETNTKHVYEGDDGWYFTDEVGELHGPFSTYEEAVNLLNAYAETL